DAWCFCLVWIGGPLQRGDQAEQSVILVVRTSREIEDVLQACSCAVPEADPPQPIDQNQTIIRALNHATSLPTIPNPGQHVDPPVAEVADEQVTAELTEVRWRPGKAPRSIKLVS